MLPRPVVKSRPGNLGYKLMNTSIWLKSLCKDIETLTINHLINQKTQTSENVLKHIEFCKKTIPQSLRICNTFFTQMIMVGSLNCHEGNIPIHVDDDDFITALLSVEGSSKTKGGKTLYIEKQLRNNKESLKISKKIPFRNGNVQIGCYHNVLHGTTRWSDSTRGVINFSMQKKFFNISINTGKDHTMLMSRLVIQVDHFTQSFEFKLCVLISLIMMLLNHYTLSTFDVPHREEVFSIDLTLENQYSV